MYKDNPEMQKLFGEREDGVNEESDADFVYFLHSQGYTHLTMNSLVISEVNQLVRGALQSQERSK